MGPRALPVGVYRFKLTVSKPAPSVESIPRSVAITIESGALPDVSHRNPHSAEAESDLQAGSAWCGAPSLGDPGRGQRCSTLTWSTSAADVDLTAASSTGVSKPNLVMLQNTLSPGATYTFTFDRRIRRP